METKTFEILDRATCLPALAIAISGSDGYLARRAGYGARCILLGPLGGGLFHFEHYDGRTMPVAHDFISKHWGNLADGEVIDVEYILGETKEKKPSEGRLP